MYLNTNKTKYKIITAKSFFKRLFGLMGKENINYGMLFPKCNSVHTFFMKENIDIIGLDINNERKNTSILEMPQNSTKKIRIGTILIFENN